MSEFQFDEKILKERRSLRLKEMQKRKHRQMLFRKYSKLLVVLVVVVLLLGSAGVAVGKTVFQSLKQSKEPEEQTIQSVEALTEEQPVEASAETIVAQMPENTVPEPTPTPTPKVYEAVMSENVVPIGEEIISSYAVFIDHDRKEILAERSAKEIISPASMTKVLTLLVAVEALEEDDLDDTFTMTIDITDYSFKNDCSNVGFLENEVIPVRDLLYGTILPSGGDAAVGLAIYVAGSHEAFVEMMNQKLAQMGLSDTAHFTNCVGLYDEEHYCTVYDMAMIMSAALENPLCREVLSTKKYTTTPTTEHPEGITISNWFLRRIEDKDTGGEVICAKTGFVNEAGSCAVSYGVDASGRQYICATADSTSSWRCIYDHVALYKTFAETSEEAIDED